MAHNVLVNVDHTVVGGAEHMSGDVVTVSDEEYDSLVADDAFTDNTLDDQGAVPDDDGDAVSTQGAAVAAPTALTSTAAAGATPTKAEFDALRTDVSNLRTTVATLITNLTGTGKPLA